MSQYAIPNTETSLTWVNDDGYVMFVRNVLHDPPGTGEETCFSHTRVPKEFVGGLVMLAGSSTKEVLVLVVFVRLLTIMYSTACVIVVYALSFSQV